MLVLAALNRYWLTPRLAQQGALLRVLVRTIALEQALAAAVLLSVSVLGLMSPSM
jgi:putative copper export protein